MDTVTVRGWRGFLACDRESRRELIRHIVKTHRANRKTYVQVMGGI